LHTAKNTLTVEKLSASIQDWKSYDPTSLGPLMLDDYLIVTTRITGHERDQKRHMFLFENAIVCCKESDSMYGPDEIRNTPSHESSLVDGFQPQPSKRTSTSVLKGIIWVPHLTNIVFRSLGACGIPFSLSFSLDIIL
jgi:hypothetical protein